MAKLFYNTVHIVNAKDYTGEQLNVWATGQIEQTGYLDRLFVHADYQGKGIATAICDQLEQSVEGNITTHASITARPFFEKRGYKVVKEQQVERKGIFLTNYVMTKER